MFLIYFSRINQLAKDYIKFICDIKTTSVYSKADRLHFNFNVNFKTKTIVITSDNGLEHIFNLDV